jgi:hypothetical protein
MTTLTEVAVRAGGFMVSEAVPHRSREKITVLSGETLLAGHVLGKVSIGASVATAAAAGNTGDGVMGTVTLSAGSKPGVYQLVITEPATDAGAFEVIDPDGVIIGTGDVAAAFSAGGLAFTLADGATNFAAGDRILITVQPGTVKYKEYDPTNTDGSQLPAGILWDAVDASAADKVGTAVVRDCEVNKEELTWFSGATSGQKTAAFAMLANLGIIGRDAV